MATVTNNEGLLGVGIDFVEAVMATRQADRFSKYIGRVSLVSKTDWTLGITRRYVSRLGHKETKQVIEAAADRDGYRLVSFSWQATN